ncbi:response regulator [Arcobacter sp. FWKO B]|uniref:response regulator n=1 Tax=Arcobacter sp. FWKO B TaxID=2593672 RepID=UPI0018A4D6BD|nr:response regulator [Arcobacter sp. FWKO B]QOG13075.1 response regulator [Arcobacter sp. FWKO B]
MNQDSFNINKELLSKATMLYIEDEDIVRQETTELFSVFFDKVLVAANGKEALELYMDNEDTIDLILTDLNMPVMNGIDFISNVRDRNWDVPILVNTGFDDSKTILKVIKLNIANYILKPIQINTTLKIISRILEESDKTKEIIRQRNELNQFMSILDSQNLICEYDNHGMIVYANENFCNISGYTIQEVCGKKYDFLKYCNSNIYDLIAKSLENGDIFSGKLKNISKDGKIFYLNSTIFPIFDKDKNIIKYRAFSYLRTEDEEEKNSMKKQIISLKSDVFKQQLQAKENETKSSEEQKSSISKTELEMISLRTQIKDLKKQNKYLLQKLDAQQKRVEDYQLQLLKIKGD